MSKYDQMLKKSEQKIFNRCGFSESEWKGLTTEQRELHYARQGVCDHPYKYKGIETEQDVFYRGDDWSLREQYSHDPYFHSTHMASCKRPGDCDCQMCLMKIGIPRDRAK